MEKIFRQTLTALLIVTSLLTAVIVSAAIQTFEGKGEWHTNDDDSPQMAMARAQQRAKIDAQKKAGIYLKTFSRSVNATLTDDDISAVTNNIIEIAGNVHFDKQIIKLSNQQTTVLYTATLKARIDPDGIYAYINRNEKEKITIIQQNNSLQDAIQKNNELAASLTEQYNRATSQAEKNRIRKQMDDADRDFLANQKLEESLKLYYASDYNGTIKICNEAIKLNPNLYGAYAYRGLSYYYLNQYEKAIQDYNKVVQLKPNNNLEYLYLGLGTAYGQLQQYDLAIKSFDKTIQLSPNLSEAYIGRGVSYTGLNQYVQAIQDFNKALQLNPNSSEAYISRGAIYVNLNQHDTAIQDFNNAILLNPNYVEAYIMRGCAYAFKGNLSQAIDDETKAIQINPNDARAYNFRGLFYKLIGEEVKSQADLARAKALGWKD